MAGAPIIISKRQQPGLQALPQLSQGERELQADISGARQVAAAEIGGIQRESAAEIGVSRAIAGEQMKASQPLVQFAGQVDKVVANLGNQILEAQSQTRLQKAQADVLTAYEKRREQYRNDTDWQTAPQRFKADIDGDQDAIFSTLSSVEQRQLQTATLRSRLSLERDINQSSVSRMTNQAQASFTESSALRLQQAARSPSGAERQGVLDDNDKQVDELVTRGIYDPTQATVLKQNFRQQLDQTDLLKGIKSNPDATLKALDDPEMFKSLTPLQRETAREQAKVAQAEAQNNQASVAVQRDKVAALATYGIIINPNDTARAGAVYDRIIQQESSGRANPPDAGKGAIGLGQLLPGTARDMATKLGLPEKDLPESEFRERLVTDPALNRRLGFAYFQEGLRLSQGSLPAAIAGYHMGQERAAKYHQKAIATFGEGYSAEQYASLIPDSINDGRKKTSDYVRDIYARMGARTDRGGVTGNAVFTVARTVESGAATLDTRELQQVQKLVTLTQDSRDAITEQFKNGYAVDPIAVAAAKAPLIAAANAGDATATVKLRDINQLEQIAPVVRQAYQLTPQQLEAGMAEMRQAVANGAATPASLQRLKVFESVSTEVAKQANENPVGLIERSGRMPVTAVPVDAAPAQIGEALQLRAPVANEALRVYDGSFKVLKPQEADALKQRWSQAQEPERLDLLRAFQGGVGSGKAYDAIVEQLGVDKLSATAGRIAAADPEVGRSILRGRSLLQQKGVDDGKASELRDALKTTLGGSTYPPSVQGELVDAALARYVDLRGGAGTLFDATDPRGLQTAIEDVTGKIATINGAKVPAPRGVPAGRLETAWSAVTAPDLGGTLLGRDGQALDFDFVKSHARLKPAGVADGRYLLAMPGPGGTDAGVRGADGRQLLFDINPVLRRLQSAFPPETDMRMLPGAAPASAGGAIGISLGLPMPRLVEPGPLP